MSINNRIKEIRIQNKLNQSEMAKKIGISQGSLSEIESEKNKPSIDTIITIFKEFEDIDPKWLLTGSKQIEKTNGEKMPFKEFQSKAEKLIEESNLSDEEVEKILIKALELGKLMSKKD